MWLFLSVSGCSAHMIPGIDWRNLFFFFSLSPVSVRPQTILVSVETQTIEVRDEMEDRRQREKEKQVSPVYPWDHMHRTARETEEQPHKLLPFYEKPTGSSVYES